MRADRGSQLFLSAAICWLVFSFAVPASAQVPDAGPGRCVLNCGPAPVRPPVYTPPVYTPPVYTPPQPSPAELQQQQANAINDQGREAQNRHDFAASIRLFEQALALSTNANSGLIIRHNIAASYS